MNKAKIQIDFAVIDYVVKIRLERGVCMDFFYSAFGQLSGQINSYFNPDEVMLDRVLESFEGNKERLVERQFLPSDLWSRIINRSLEPGPLLITKRWNKSYVSLRLVCRQWNRCCVNLRVDLVNQDTPLGAIFGILLKTDDSFKKDARLSRLSSSLITAFLKKYGASLRTLNLRGCGYMTGKTFIRISPQLTQLQSLNLSGCIRISDEAFKAVAQLPKLQNLEISSNWPRLWQLWFPGEGLTAIELLTDLQSLDFSGCCQLTDKILGAISQLPKLQNLDVSGLNEFTNEGLIRISQLQNLQTLNLSVCKGFTEKGLIKAIEALPNLQRLGLWGGTQITDEVLECLNGRAITFLSLEEGLHILGRCQSLL